LQLWQATYCIKCYITVNHHDSRTPPPYLLQQRRAMLSFLTHSIEELSKPHMSKLPGMCLECPYHENELPHIELDIDSKRDLVCDLGGQIQIIDGQFYSCLYESTIPGLSSGECAFVQ